MSKPCTSFAFLYLHSRARVDNSCGESFKLQCWHYIFRGLVKWREIKIRREYKGTFHDVRSLSSGNVDSEEIFALKRKRHTHKAEALSTEWKTMEISIADSPRYTSIRVRFVVVAAPGFTFTPVHTFDAFKFLWANKLPHICQDSTLAEYSSRNIRWSGNYYCASCSLLRDLNAS